MTLHKGHYPQDGTVSQAKIKNMIFASLFASLYMTGTFIRIPLPPVPFVLTNFFVVLGGYALGPLWGFLSVGLYVITGLLGIPVFASGGGISAFFSPTGGYIAGYFLCSVLAGLFRNIGKGRLPGLIAGGLSGLLAIYITGIPWFMYTTGFGFTQALYLGFLPFIIGDCLKLAGAISLITTIQRYKPGFLLNYQAK